MPYIKVKVSQDLYEELGLCPNMELVYSDSKGSIKFVPSSSTKVLGDYESPLLTSPLFGNQLDTEEEASTTVSRVFHKEHDQNIDGTLSANISGECIDKKLISSCKVFVDSSLVESGPVNSYGTPNETLKNDASQCMLSEEGYKSQDIIFVKRADLSQSVNSGDVGLCEDNKSDPVSTGNSSYEIEATYKGKPSVKQFDPYTNSSPVTKNSESNLLFQQHPPNNFTKPTTSRLNIKVGDVSCIELDSRGRVSSLSFTPPELRNTKPNAQGLNLSVSRTPSASDMAECKACLNKSSFSRHSKYCNNKVKYPRKCESCLSFYNHGSSFTRHKKTCKELRERKLMKAAVKSDCDPKTLESVLKQKDVITYPRICDKCGLIFEKKESFRGHLRRCEKYQRIQTISTNSERKILPSCADNSVIDFVSNNQMRYIPVKGISKSTRRFFVKMKTTADID